MLDLTQTLHAQGFQAGAYRRSAQCSGVPTSRQADDAATYLSWQIDLLKIVRCQVTDPVQQDVVHGRRLPRRGSSGRLSLVAPPFAEWMPDARNWRDSAPIQATWAIHTQRVGRDDTAGRIREARGLQRSGYWKWARLR